MTIPTTPTWDLADFSGATFSLMLGLAPSDLTALPSVSPYFAYNQSLSIINVKADDGVEASLSFHVGMPSRYTLDVLLRCPNLPHNLGNLSDRRFGITVADDAGRGFTMYLAKTGLAISRVSSYGSVTALPDTSDVTQAVATDFYTVRIAVDGSLGRAYVFVGAGATDTPALRAILPIEQTPDGMGDVFRIFAKGRPTEPVFVEIQSLRLATDLIVANYPPIADAGPDRVTAVGNAMRFDGRASYDVEGAPLSYHWQCIDAPYQSVFSAEASGVETHDDGDADDVTATLQLAPNTIPSWLAPGDVVLLQGGVYEVSSVDALGGGVEVTVDGVADNLSAASVRFIRQSILLDTHSPTPVAVADLPGLYRFRLIVNDGELDSEPSEVLAHVTALQTPLGIEPDVSIIWKAIGDEWRFIEGKEVFEEAWIGVAQVLAGKMLEAWQHHYNTSIRDAQRVFQRKWVAYRTMELETAPEEVTFSARHGAFLATFPFEKEDAPLAGLTLVIEPLQQDGDVASVPLQFASTLSVADLVTVINDAVSPSDGVWAEACGTREALADLQVLLRGHTTGSGTTLELDAGGWPSWVAVGSLLCLGTRQFPVISVESGVPSFADLPPNLPTQQAALYAAARLVLGGSAPFRLSGSACDVLGLPTGEWNHLQGVHGARVTDRTYYVEGVDLARQGVQQGDLLVLNNGESFAIDRLLSDPLDPLPNQRVLLFDTLPADATDTWVIPSVVRSVEVDYERAGVYPGDLLKTEIYTRETGDVITTNSLVVAQKGEQLAVALGTEVLAGMLAAKELRVVGVKRRKALPLPDDVVSVPTLQALIAASLNPPRLREHVDYVLEPFYRDTGGGALPMLQFTDAAFITPDLEPPDVLWAEVTLFDNERNVEALFGRLVGFLRDDAASFSKDFNYVSGVAGLLYAQQRGPNLFAMSVGAQILLGQPFAEVEGYIEEIRSNYAPQQGRILVRDADGNVPTQSDTLRAYYWQKNPVDLSETSGLAANPETDRPWTTGEFVPQFSAIGAGIEINDVYTDPKWWKAFVGSGQMFEVEKFHRFVCTFDLSVVELANVSLLASFLTRVKPRYTRAMLVGAENMVDDLDVLDSALLVNTLKPLDSFLGREGYHYDDYLGSGDTSSHPDDGVLRADALTDNILDLISFEITINWPGGALTFPTTWPFQLGTPVVDVSGAETGTAGSSFSLVQGMDLAAGTYKTTCAIKSGPVLPPL